MAPPTPGRAEALVERLHALHPKLIDLSLDRLHGLLARLGHPEPGLAQPHRPRRRLDR